MSPTAEQTEERSQHDEEDGSKRSLRRFSTVVQRLHWKYYICTGQYLTWEAHWYTLSISISV